MSFLVANNLSFQDRHNIIINKIDITLSLGEFVVIIGPNGAGKSTLLKLLSGYLSPSQGSIYLAQKKLSEYLPISLASKRAVMQQELNLELNITVFDLITFARPFKQVILEKRENSGYRTILDDSLNEIIRLTQCENLLNRYINSLSGGEKQRVLLARTLYQIWESSSEGVGVFLDEPTSSLDIYYQQYLLKCLKQLTKERKIMICAILHDINLAALYADRMIVIKEGTIKTQGTVTEVMTHPKLLEWFNLAGGIIQHPVENSVAQIFLKP